MTKLLKRKSNSGHANEEEKSPLGLAVVTVIIQVRFGDRPDDEGCKLLRNVGHAKLNGAASQKTIIFNSNRGHLWSKRKVRTTV